MKRRLRRALSRLHNRDGGALRRAGRAGQERGAGTRRTPGSRRPALGGAGSAVRGEVGVLPPPEASSLRAPRGSGTPPAGRLSRLSGALRTERPGALSKPGRKRS